MPNVARVSAVVLSELIRSVASVRYLCQLDEERSETHSGIESVRVFPKGFREKTALSRTPEKYLFVRNDPK